MDELHFGVHVGAPHMEGSAMVADCSCDDLLEKRCLVMRGWADCSENLTA